MRRRRSLPSPHNNPLMPYLPFFFPAAFGPLARLGGGPSASQPRDGGFAASGFAASGFAAFFLVLAAFALGAAGLAGAFGLGGLALASGSGGAEPGGVNT